MLSMNPAELTDIPSRHHSGAGMGIRQVDPRQFPANVSLAALEIGVSQPRFS